METAGPTGAGFLLEGRRAGPVRTSRSSRPRASDSNEASTGAGVQMMVRVIIGRAFALGQMVGVRIAHTPLARATGPGSADTPAIATVAQAIPTQRA